MDSEVGWTQLVQSPVTTAIDLNGDGVDRVTIDSEGGENASLVARHAWIDPPQRILTHQEKGFEGTVMPPEPHSAPRRIIGTASIGKTKRHRLGAPRQAPSPHRVRPRRPT